jgi:hypothetical protein
VEGGMVEASASVVAGGSSLEDRDYMDLSFVG